MNNCIITITGQKGSGKTSYAKYLASKCTRVIVVDRMVEYEGDIFTDFGVAIDHLAENWYSDFCMVVRFDNDIYYRELFRYLFLTTGKCPTKPFSLVVEEADFFCSPHSIEPQLDALYKYGRHRSINLLSIARGDTDLHRSVLNNSDIVVAFRQRKFSRDMRERFTADDLQKALRLETLTPQTGEPKKDFHFLTYPPEDDPSDLWISCQTLDIEHRTRLLEGVRSLEDQT